MVQQIVDYPVITIDGSSGVGKGTVSQRLAQYLDWHYLDSGALYRVLALSIQKLGIDLQDERALADQARYLDVVFQRQNIYLYDQDVSQTIRTEECAAIASKIAAFAAVREALLERQRNFLLAPGLVADGRDMGTTVFPQAKCKFFLQADAKVRAQRRYLQLKDQGINANLENLFKDISERDKRDALRSISPLKAASDAYIIDTSTMSADEVFDDIKRRCQDYI